MVTHDCDTCEGSGEVLTMVPGFTGEPVEDTVDCPDCGGYGFYQTPDAFERLVGPERAARIRAPFRRTKRRIDWARVRWAERDAERIGAVVVQHKNALDDEPRLRSIIENDLMRQLADVTPLRWRQADLRWCRDNARRALRGEPMLPLPYDEQTSLSIHDENADLFQRNAIALRAERHRKPRA